MARTEVRSGQVKDGSINSDDIDITTVGKSLITKIIAGSGISLGSTGADSGTGAVTLTATTDVRTAEIDFGSVSTNEGYFSIADASILAGQQICALQSYDAATGRTADENEFATMHLIAGQAVVGVGFSLYVKSISGCKELQGKFKINYFIG